MRRLRSNKLFEWITVLAILVLSLTIGVKSYNLPAGVETAIIVADKFITLFFLAEIIVRIIAAGSLRRFFRSGWNIFDFIIVVGSLIPLDESEDVLLLRLLRLFRVMRLILIVPELRVLITTLFRAIPRVGYVVLMMFIIFYLYGAAGNIFFETVNPALWGNIGRAMLTLFRVATFEDWTDVMYETMEIYPFSWLYYLSFIFLSAFIFLNLMIGVIIDVLHEEYNADERKKNEARQAVLIERLQRIEATLERLTRTGSDR